MQINQLLLGESNSVFGLPHITDSGPWRASHGAVPVEGYTYARDTAVPKNVGPVDA